VLYACFASCPRAKRDPTPKCTSEQTSHGPMRAEVIPKAHKPLRTQSAATVDSESHHIFISTSSQHPHAQSLMCAGVAAAITLPQANDATALQGSQHANCTHSRLTKAHAHARRLNNRRCGPTQSAASPWRHSRSSNAQSCRTHKLLAAYEAQQKLLTTVTRTAKPCAPTTTAHTHRAWF
jgi:hypothetical protein